MRTVRIGVALGLLIAVAGPPRAAAGQIVSGVVPGIAPAQPPPRDPSVRRTGTAVVRGRIVDAMTGAAVPRARVRVGGAAAPRPSVLTSATGEFSFAGLPAGPLALTVERSGYQAGSFPDRGRSLRASMGAPMVLTEGEVRADITIRLFRGGVIAGRVIDAYGDPVELAEVRAMRVSGPGGRPMMRNSVQTNDLGEFRISRLEPGQFVLMAVAQRRGMDETALNAKPEPQPLPTYYPSAWNVSEAHVIPLERGQTVPGIEITLLDGTPTIVTGTLTRADGQGLGTGGFVNARLIGRESGGGYMSAGGGPVRPDGSFRLSMAPGEYVIEARLNQTPLPGMSPSPEREEFGMTRVVVGGEAMDVSIVVGKGATAAGRVIFEGTTPPPAVPGVNRAPLNSQDGSCRHGQLTLAPDWSFKLEGLSGSCSAPPMPGFGRWTLKAVTMDGHDLLKDTFLFQPGQHYGNVQVVVTDRRPEVTLAVSDDHGERTREYVALVFPVDRERWKEGTPFVRMVVPPSLATLELMQHAARASGAPQRPGGTSFMDTTRRELVWGLTAGEYYAIAVDDIDPEAAHDPAVLDRLASGALRLTIADGPGEIPLRRVKLADVVR